MERGTLDLKELYSEYFYYDPLSPTGLRWKKSIYAGRTGRSLIVAKGSPAGCFVCNKNGTPKSADVRLKGRLHKVHRIIYVIELGNFASDLVIDHLDQNPWNNLLSNLSLKSRAENHRNRKMVPNNSSGITGVSWQGMNGGRHTYAVARVVVDGRVYSSRFGTHRFGLLPAFKMAVLWRQAKIKELNEKYDAGFTELHGL